MRDRIIEAMRGVFGDDHRRIWHALQVLANADALVADTPESDPVVVVAAAILHDIGIPEAERRHGSPAGRYQEIEGPPIAGRLLVDLGLDDERIDHVCRIIANHHSARGIDTPEFRIIWDADWLVNWYDECPDLDRQATAARIDRIFRTPAGKGLARQRFLSCC